MIYDVIIEILSGYFIGSIPFGLIFAKMSGLGDIRKIGSGNIGATNALRAGGIKLALPVALCDVLKATIAFRLFGVWGGFAAVIGHTYPIWLGFMGGKGIAATFGFMLGLSPQAFLLCGAVWLIVAFGFGYSSLAALSMLTVMPFFGFYFYPDSFWFCIALTFLGFWRHKENIKRLISGTESKISFRKNK
ncbi:MAG: glycerol-3-phosphate 1-O-acyltransferase PlsY [Rickettsiales bacterium]|jgi:glycerol-3-phosphate acyltransferase PlsY|nr:glycerol-3-phosphate 1-O-acyltransferase PlsY [Rickettsiales bacterium]